MGPRSPRLRSESVGVIHVILSGRHHMRNAASISIPALLVLLALSPLVIAQTSSAALPPGWLPCPRCQSQQDRTQARAKYGVDTHPFNPRDLSGIWGNNGMELNVVVPP